MMSGLDKVLLHDGVCSVIFNFLELSEIFKLRLVHCGYYKIYIYSNKLNQCFDKVLNIFLNIPLEKNRKYTVIKTAQRNHPESNEQLSVVITNIFNIRSSPKSLLILHDKIYRLLEEKKGLYIFYHDIEITNEHPLRIYSSPNLIFWMIINNKNKIIKNILETYTDNIFLCKDEMKNNLLHIACFFGNIEVINYIKENSGKYFSKLLNTRNVDGTTPLGMVFLDNKNNHRGPDLKNNIEKVCEILLPLKELDINDYLINKKGLDYTAHKLLKKIGGFNCLHISLIYNNEKILEMLYNRNKKLGWYNNYSVNFNYPSSHIDYYMFSPQKIFEDMRHNHTSDFLNIWNTINNTLLQEDTDESGDSSDTETSAYIYKHELLKLVDIISECDNITYDDKMDNILNLPINTSSFEKKYVKDYCNSISITHFHGVTFPMGHYNTKQKLDIAKYFFKINNHLLSLQRDNVKDLSKNYIKNTTSISIKSLYCKTSTFSCGIDNLYYLTVLQENNVKDLMLISTLINNYLSDCWKNDETIFLKYCLENYIYDYSNEQKWKDFWYRLNNIKEVDKEIIKYRYPFLSTSKAPDHAVKYAMGCNLEINKKGQFPLYPKYNDKGYPKHILMGFVFIITHSLSELTKLEIDKKITDITHLICNEKIKNDARIKNQIETTFFGGIDNKNILAVVPIIYPNFSKGFKKGYHDKVWGYENIDTKRKNKNIFKNAKNEYKGQKYLDIYNKVDNGNISCAGKVIKPGNDKLILNLTEKITHLQGNRLYYSLPNGEIKRFDTGYNKEKYFSNLQLDVINTLNKKEYYQERIYNTIIQNTEKIVINTDNVKDVKKINIPKNDNLNIGSILVSTKDITKQYNCRNCKKGCSNRHCICFKNDEKCDSKCGCKDCNNN
jgi:hypothetical protein